MDEAHPVPRRDVHPALADSAELRYRPAVAVIERDDDRFWRAGGLFYVNRDDPAVLVPKRIGIGWTVNFGNPWGAVIIAATLLVVLGIVLRSALPS